MANPFTSFAYPASGSNQSNRTTPNRIFDTKNVKDFGAKGDGVTDDWAAITAAFAAIASTAASFDQDYRGIVFFPPGTYLISKSVLFDAFIGVNQDISVFFIGEMGASTVTGNFADYLFKSVNGFGKQTVFDKLTLTNTNASGGAIRFGGNIDSGAIRNCNITANQGINSYNTDSDVSPAGAFELSIENCVLDPGSNIISSRAIVTGADGPILNCRITNYATGIRMAVASQAQFINGCYFEKCGVAIEAGVGPGGTALSANNVVVSGCWFKNNSIAIRFGTSSSPAGGSNNAFLGLRIEGADGQAPSGGNSQYGISLGTTGGGTGPSDCIFAGIVITGNYDIAGFFLPGSGGGGGSNTLMGVNVTNGSATGGALPWSLNTTNSADEGDRYIACNQTNVITVAHLPTESEGAVYNVNDGTASLAWGAAVTGGHSTHYLVRNNSTTPASPNFTVVGQ